MDGQKSLLVVAGSSDTLSNILDVEDETDEFPDEASKLHTDSCFSRHMSRLEDSSGRFTAAGYEN